MQLRALFLAGAGCACICMFSPAKAAVHVAASEASAAPASATSSGSVLRVINDSIYVPRAKATGAMVSPTGKPEPTPAMAPKPDTWPVAKGQHLRAVVAAWATKAGWVVYWDPAGIDPDTDYAMEVPNTFTGSFDEAIKGLFRALPPELALRVDLRTANSPHLLVVTANRGNP